MKILAISLNTFREAIRNKVLYSLLFFAFAVIVGSLAFGALAVHEDQRLTIDLGFAGMNIFLLLIAVFTGVSLLYKELERKTVYTLIPKPIHRYQFVLGKYLGLLLTLTVLLLTMSAVLTLVISLKGGGLRLPHLMMIALTFCEVLVVTAIAVFFSSFSTPFLSGLFTVGLFILGRSVPDIQAAAGKLEDPLAKTLLQGMARVLPNLRYLYVSGAEADGHQLSLHGTFVDWTYVGWAALYTLLYTAIVLCFAAFFFSRRDFI